MKKINRLFIATILAMTTFFTGCTDTLLYDLINEEVSLETGIGGDIYSIVRYKDKIYLSNGKVYSKTAALSDTTGKFNGQWTCTTNPNESSSEYYGKQFIHLAADKYYLYALVIESIQENNSGNNTESSRGIYYSSDGKRWTKNTNITGTINTVFCNNAFDEDYRRAYVRLNDTTPMKLSGGNSPETITGITAINIDPSSYSCTCVASGTDFFASCDSVASNYYDGIQETVYAYYSGSKYSGNSKSLSSKLKYYNVNNNSTNEIAIDAGNILSIDACKDYILLGTDSGLARVGNNGGVPSSSTSRFDNNGNTVITTSVLKVFIIDPSKTMDENDMYASSTIYGSINNSGVSFKNTGLYAFYSKRGNWNKDGTSSKSGN